MSAKYRRVVFNKLKFAKTKIFEWWRSVKPRSRGGFVRQNDEDEIHMDTIPQVVRLGSRSDDERLIDENE